jgi:DNA-binding transcriptional MerR regulator
MEKSETKYYKLGEVAGMLGLSKRTIIRYEKNKIFPPARRNKINRWREYTSQDIEKLKKILGRA